MRLLELLGRRWLLRILWELRDEPLTFRELRAACDEVSPTVLNLRLKELTASGFVEHTGEGYGLTPHGKELLHLLQPLNLRAKEWFRG